MGIIPFALNLYAVGTGVQQLVCNIEALRKGDYAAFEHVSPLSVLDVAGFVVSDIPEVATAITSRRVRGALETLGAVVNGSNVGDVVEEVTETATAKTMRPGMGYQLEVTGRTGDIWREGTDPVTGELSDVGIDFERRGIIGETKDWNFEKRFYKTEFGQRVVIQRVETQVQRRLSVAKKGEELYWLFPQEPPKWLRQTLESKGVTVITWPKGSGRWIP